MSIKYAAWAVIGIVLGAAYLLWLYQRVMFGPVTNPANEHLPDLNMREYATLVPLVLLAFWIGIYPKPLFTVLERPVQQIVRAGESGILQRGARATLQRKRPSPLLAQRRCATPRRTAACRPTEYKPTIRPKARSR